LTGCLVQGSGPTVFILENAKTSTDTASSAGKSYVLDTTGASVDFKSHLNQQVRIVGNAPAATGSSSSMGSSSSGSSMGSSSSSGSSSSGSSMGSSSSSGQSGQSAGSSSSGQAGQSAGSSSSGQSGQSAGSSSAGPSSSSSSQSAGASRPSTGQSTAASERTMPKLTARTITKVADTCPAS
jgi:hypothetical protein